MATLISFGGKKSEIAQTSIFMFSWNVKKRKWWVHGFQPISQQRSAAVLRNWFQRHTTNQIEQEQLIYEGAIVLQKLMIKNLNRKLIAVILTNVDTSVKSMNCYSSSCFALHLKQTHTMQNIPC